MSPSWHEESVQILKYFVRWFFISFQKLIWTWFTTARLWRGVPLLTRRLRLLSLCNLDQFDHVIKKILAIIVKEHWKDLIGYWNSSIDVLIDDIVNLSMKMIRPWRNKKTGAIILLPWLHINHLILISSWKNSFQSS